MQVRSHWLVALVLVSAGCGDNLTAGPDLSGDILDALRTTPEIASVEELGTDLPGYRYFAIQFDQPVDHHDPDGPHFLQYVSLIHRDADAPMVLLHTGYANWYRDIPQQLTWILQANQASVEHRFFGTSRPDGVESWRFLTIEQSAADHHRITQALRRIYAAAWLETGASKGGMTSVYHRRLYPDDLDGTVAYVAPLSFGAPDDRYDAFIDTIGPKACRDQLRDLQVEMLRERRAAFEALADAQATQWGYAYTRVALGPAVESAITGAEWAFWQYAGVSACDRLPEASASDEVLWEFLEDVSPVSSSSDDDIAAFEAYYYQASAELGFPSTFDDHLAGLTLYTGDDFAGSFPLGVEPPAFRAEAMIDIDTWVRTDGDRLIFLYGEWDPWTGGMFELGEASDSMRLVAAQATHGASIEDLYAGEQDAVFAALEAWTGVAPDPDRLFRRRPIPPPPLRRVPPAIWRGLQLQRR